MYFYKLNWVCKTSSHTKRQTKRTYSVRSRQSIQFQAHFNTTHKISSIRKVDFKARILEKKLTFSNRRGWGWGLKYIMWVTKMHYVSWDRFTTADNYRARAGRREKFFGTANAIRYCQRAFPTEFRLKFLKFSLNISPKAKIFGGNFAEGEKMRNRFFLWPISPVDRGGGGVSSDPSRLSGRPEELQSIKPYGSKTLSLVGAYEWRTQWTRWRKTRDNPPRTDRKTRKYSDESNDHQK